ncbi:MAG TPA: TIGR03560 family F420-dependent LLM class oxidoreductase [Actinomycetota bacterium]|nr:TIGR03560 family F420-dependent LLM class oxidoreductase [Actinomycetota bacterium]
MHLGALVPQGWKHDLDGLDPQAAFAKMIEVAQRCESLGLDSIWLYDHFHAVPWPAEPGVPVFECWTGMMALAMRTERVRLGQMVTCTPYRNPGYLAKIAACVDVASGGRLEFGLGGGWYEEEYVAYGYGFHEPRERLGHLRDTVNIVERMWRDERATYDGTYVSVKDAVNDPKPLQSPRPRVWIGGGGEQITLRITAGHADWANFMGDVDTFKRKRDIMRGYAEEMGRDPASIKLSIHCEMLVAPDEPALGALTERHPSIFGRPEEQRRATNLIGTTQQVIDKIAAYADLGCEAVIPWFPDYPDSGSLEIFATEIRAAFA